MHCRAAQQLLFTALQIGGIGKHLAGGIFVEGHHGSCGTGQRELENGVIACMFLHTVESVAKDIIGIQHFFLSFGLGLGSGVGSGGASG